MSPAVTRGPGEQAFLLVLSRNTPDNGLSRRTDGRKAFGLHSDEMQEPSLEDRAGCNQLRPHLTW